MTDLPDQPTAAPYNADDPVLTRAELAGQIQARLDGRISDAQLAAWAFDRFYAEEIGAEDYEAGAEPLIADALDELMFGDDPSFRLDEAGLRALLARLGSP